MKATPLRNCVFVNIKKLSIFIAAMELAMNRPKKLITPAGHPSLTGNQLYEQVHLTVAHQVTF